MIRVFDNEFFTLEEGEALLNRYKAYLAHTKQNDHLSRLIFRVANESNDYIYTIIGKQNRRYDDFSDVYIEGKQTIDIKTIMHDLVALSELQAEKMEEEALNKLDWPHIFEYSFNSKGDMRLDKYIGCDISDLTIPGHIEGHLVSEISEMCFKENHQLTRVRIRNGVTRISDKAFYGCWCLQEVELPDTIQELGGGIFFACHNLQKVRLPCSLEYIPDDMFFYCEMLQEVVLPHTVISIKSGAFLHCKKLKSIILPPNLKTIEFAAFNCCGALKELHIPKSVNEIGYVSSMQTFSKKTTLIVHPHTIAEEFAIAKKYSYQYEETT